MQAVGSGQTEADTYCLLGREDRVGKMKSWLMEQA
jgi:hypothetical protein